MSYRFVESFGAGTYAPAQKLSTNLYDIYQEHMLLLKGCLQTCMTYTRSICSCSKAVYKPVWHIPGAYAPAQKLSTNLYDIYQEHMLLLKSCLQTCMAYTRNICSCSRAVYKPVWHIPGAYAPTQKLSTNLYDIYQEHMLLLKSCLQTCMANTRSICFSQKLSTNLYDIYHC